MRSLFFLALLALLTGCTRYDFQLTEPRDLARTIGYKEQVRLALPPIEYRMQAAENHLVIQVHNTTDEQIDFIGERSYAVAPTGQSHPFRNQSIAPRAFIKLILPPMPPVYRAEPRFGIGVGYGYRYGPWHYGAYGPYAPYGYGWYDPYLAEPRYFSVADGSDAFYWDWPGQGAVPLRLTFQRRGEQFHHDFTFQKRKM